MQNTFSRRDLIVPQKKQLQLGILCWVMFALGFELILMHFFDLETSNGLYWFQISNFCAMFILTAICFMPFLKESLQMTKLRELPKLVLIGFGMYWGISYCVSAILMILQDRLGETTVNVNQDAINTLTRYNPLPMFICTCILVPVTEECLVRGVIFAPLCRQKPWLAYVISSLIFSALHLIASIGHMSWYNVAENLLTYLPSGIVLGWAYQRSGTIIGSIALHCFMNFIAMLLNMLILR